MKRYLFLLLAIFTLVLTVPVMAQDNVTVLDGAEEFLLGLAGFFSLAQALVELAVRFAGAGPGTLDSKVVDKWLTVLAITVYVIAGGANVLDQLKAGTEFIKALSPMLLGLLVVIFGPDVARPKEEKLVIGRVQGEELFSLAAPKE